MKIDVEGDLPSPSGRGQGEGLSICIDLRPSPAAARRPLPKGEVMPRMHAPRATFCEKSPSLKFCPASVGQQPLQPAFAFGTLCPEAGAERGLKPATTLLIRRRTEIHEKFGLESRN